MIETGEMQVFLKNKAMKNANMASNTLAVILYNKVSKGASIDEMDVLLQVDAVVKALEQLGYTVIKQAFSDNPDVMLNSIKKAKPLFVFNLVESVLGKGKLSYLAPAILESLNIKYTGCSALAILLTTNKIITKKLLKSCGIPTPPWVTLNDNNGFAANDKYIVKAIYEDGSIGINQDSVVTVKSINELREKIKAEESKTGNEVFAEKFVDGTEIHISILGNGGKPRLLYPSKIEFTGFEEKNDEKILDYRAKWEEDSIEYKNTVSINNVEDCDRGLIEELNKIAVACWHEFELKGYARIDFRIDNEGRPWVLEINANPCITPGESSFTKSAEKSGFDFNKVIENISLEL